MRLHRVSVSRADLRQSAERAKSAPTQQTKSKNFKSMFGKERQHPIQLPLLAKWYTWDVHPWCVQVLAFTRITSSGHPRKTTRGRTTSRPSWSRNVSCRSLSARTRSLAPSRPISRHRNRSQRLSSLHPARLKGWRATASTARATRMPPRSGAWARKSSCAQRKCLPR